MKKLKKPKRKKPASGLRPARVAMPDDPGDRIVTPPAPGEPLNVEKMPRVLCPRCGGQWFVEMCQYRVVPPAVYAPGSAAADAPWRRLRAAVGKCAACNQWVSLPESDGPVGAQG